MEQAVHRFGDGIGMIYGYDSHKVKYHMSKGIAAYPHKAPALIGTAVQSAVNHKERKYHYADDLFTQYKNN